MLQVCNQSSSRHACKQNRWSIIIPKSERSASTKTNVCIHSQLLASTNHPRLNMGISPGDCRIRHLNFKLTRHSS